MPQQEELLAHFRSIFWDGFFRPDLKSDTFLNIWQSLEPTNDWLAGPLFSIYQEGNCSYLFTNDERFPAIKTTDDFLNWATTLVNEYRDALIIHAPTTEDESQDLQILLFQTDIKMELVDIAYQIQNLISTES